MTFSVNGNTVITSDRIVQLTTGATASRPASPVVGQMFFDTTLSKVIVWNGAVWQESIGSINLESVYIPSAWAWGSNAQGQLGDNTTTSRSSPVSVVGGFTDWVQISAGGSHTAAIRANGTAWTWGSSYAGRLADGDGAYRSSPRSVLGGFTDWIQISASDYTIGHNAAIRANGTAWTWGRNNKGQLGDGTTNNRSSPASVVGGFTDWIQISAGYTHTVAIRANGQAWGWGYNFYGRLGDGTSTNRSSPVSVVGGFTDWTQISAGHRHTAAVRANGEAWCWGSGANGRLGTNNTTNRSSPTLVAGFFTDWIQISAGAYHTVAIRANGQAWAWGWNISGQVSGITLNTSRNSPVSVVGGFTDWVQITAGSRFTLAIRSNGQAWAWGQGNSGQLGTGSTLDQNSPVSVVGGFTDWVQISGGNSSSGAIRSQPKIQSGAPRNEGRNRLDS